MKDSLINSHFPRVTILRQWLTLSKSKIFTFKLNLDTIYAFSNSKIREEIFAEYRLATGTKSAARYGKISIVIMIQRRASNAWQTHYGVAGENISHLLRIAQRSPYFSELYIESDLDYGPVLSLNKQLGSLLSRQLVILPFTTKEANSSLGDLVRIIDKLDVGEVKQSATIFIHTHALNYFK
ncbi:unnamed protein product [Rotaria magnacalcarata]|uniref:Uncharacterized protein n=3 Tax=Rotaria magnacalcarata TaxID=392030 RepID=A0A816TXI1_9BILA|nr:unnamed protein product [Rotaria magnacalcarata]